MLLLWATSPSSISFVAATEGGILEIFLIPRLLSNLCFSHNYLHPADYVIGSLYLFVCLSVSRITTILWTDLPFQYFFFIGRAWSNLDIMNFWEGSRSDWNLKKKKETLMISGRDQTISNESSSRYASGSSKSIQAWCRKKIKNLDIAL